MKTDNATPSFLSIPWMVNDNGGDDVFITTENDVMVLEDVPLSTAKIIVKAVNCYDLLMGTLKEVNSLIQSELDAHGDSDLLNDAKRKIKKAISKKESRG